MTRNSALRGLSWIIVMVVINVTPLGRILENTFINFALEHGVVPTPATANGPWWCAFLVWTVVCWYLGDIFVALWGTKEEEKAVTTSAPMPVKPAAPTEPKKPKKPWFTYKEYG